MDKKSIGQEMVDGLTELVAALEASDDLGGRFTCYTVKLNLQPVPYTPELVRQTRQLLAVSQVIFAQFLGVSANTVRAWEQGKTAPKPMACRFMDEIRRTPDHYRQRLRDSLTTKAGGPV